MCTCSPSSVFLQNKTFYIGSDHAGFHHKQEIIRYFSEKKIPIEDKGTFSEASCDYPDYAYAVAKEINLHPQARFGILVCGSANGVAMTANKLPYVRAAICWNEEVTSLARKHNDANIICIPGRFVNVGICIQYIHIFCSTPFEGERHQQRVDKMMTQNRP